MDHLQTDQELVAQTGDLSGTAAVINGQIIITDPVGSGKPARIGSNEGIKLKINGREIEGHQPVTTRDQLEVSLPSSSPSWAIKVRVAPDNMEAFMQVESIPGRVEVLDDGPASPVLLLKARLIAVSEPEPLTLTQLEAKLDSHGVIFGRLEKNLNLLVQEAGELQVALGNPVVPSQDAIIEYRFKTKGETIHWADDAQQVDLLYHTVINSVEAGQVLAVKTSMRLGRKGMDIFGKEVSPPMPNDVKLQAGSGAELLENGTKVVASISGRPDLKNNAILVYPGYTIQGDVDKTTGHIKFKGDISIRGNVGDGMQVMATGRVEIMGDVTMARVTSGNDLIVHRNVLGSHLRAGGNQVAYLQLRQRLEDANLAMHKLLEGLGETAKQGGRAALRNPGVVLHWLYENRQPNLQHVFGELMLSLRELSTEIPEGIIDNVSKIAQSLEPSKMLAITEQSFIQNLFRDYFLQSGALKEVIGKLEQGTAVIIAGYVQQSQLEASGSITLTGKGSVSSELWAGAGVRVTGTPGVIRGGRVTAGGNVIARELGSPGEVVTIIEVPTDCQVKAPKIYPGVVLRERWV